MGKKKPGGSFFRTIPGFENLFKQGLVCVAHLLDDAGDGGGGLGANSEPFVGFFEIKSVVLTFDHGVIGSNLLDVSTVTALTAVDGYDLVIGAVF